MRDAIREYIEMKRDRELIDFAEGIIGGRFSRIDLVRTTGACRVYMIVNNKVVAVQIFGSYEKAEEYFYEMIEEYNLLSFREKNEILRKQYEKYVSD